MLIELAELDTAFAHETTYARLSVLCGNHAGKAEAPLVLAAVELPRGRLPQADALIATARKAAELNDWDMLSTWARALTGRLRLQRFKSGGDVLGPHRTARVLISTSSDSPRPRQRAKAKLLQTRPLR